MDIDVERQEPTNPVSELGYGETFFHDEQLYIKTGSKEGQLHVCVRLKDGLVKNMAPAARVTPIETVVRNCD
jgi:hypothetical protein